jgi:hypothetical protein
VRQLQLRPSSSQPQAVVLLQHGLSRPQPGHPDATHLHDPVTQLSPAAQACVEPHPPQLFRSVCSLTQAPLQAVYPALHLNVHVLETHAGSALATPPAHMIPQPLQLFGSVVGSTHVPEQTSESGAVQPLTHDPFEQTGVPPVHLCWHVPQLFGSADVSMQEPLHREVGELQVKVQLLPVQIGEALATFVVHALPQLPQLLGSVRLSTQAPPQRV